jgi:putative hemolysin
MSQHYQPVTPTPSMDMNIRAGELVVTLASTAEEVLQAQKLRYHYFSGADEAETDGIDYDNYDTVCDHLLVKDLSRPTLAEQVVGTYRLIRRPAMEALGRFYSETEFDLGGIKQFPGDLLELGRSCVKEEYRSRAVMQLLWRGITAYIIHHKIGLMFGCASFHGIDPAEHAHALAYLHHYHLAPPELRAHAIGAHAIDLNMMPKDQIDPKRAFAEVAPLIKGYLRLNGYIGHGAYIDHHCKTIDVCIVVQTDLVTEKYIQRYTPDVPGGEN